MTKIQFFIERKNTDGTIRYYWQPSAKWRILGFPITALPQEEIAAKQKAIELNAELKTWALSNPDIVKPAEEKVVINRGSVDTLISTFRMSSTYKHLAPKTKQDYEVRFKQIRAIFGQELVRTITPTVCYRFYEKQREISGIHVASSLFKVFRRLLSFAMLPPLSLINQNPASNIQIEKPDPRSSVWTPEAITAFLETTDRRHPSVSLAFRLALYTAQRQSDILAMKWSDYKNGIITLTQQKTGQRVYVPIYGELTEKLENTAKKSIFIVTNEISGRPYKADRFKKLFAIAKQQAQEEHPGIDFSNLKFIDLRRTAAVRMAEAGCTAFEVAAVTGHKIDRSQEILDTYAPPSASMAIAGIEKVKRKFG